MDPNLPQTPVMPAAPSNVEPAPPPKDIKTQVTEASNEFVKNNYEGILRKTVNIIYALITMLKNSLLSMINMAFNRGD
jgi:hypothetical protein